jgi:hypothetical protein
MVVKRNLLLARYLFERLAKSFKRGELQRRWGEKVTIQRPGAKPMFGLGAGGRDFQDSTEGSNPSLRNRDMRQPADFTSPASAASSTGRCNTTQCVDSTMLPRGEAICLAVLGQNLARVVFRLI